jgi:ParB family transcriptional regulator, chromosome partitioning protein
LINNKLEMGHARSLLTLSSEQQIILAHRIVEKNLTVRDAERLVQLSKLPKEEKIQPYADKVDTWVSQLSNTLSSKVAININEKGEGRVIIHFSSPDEMDWLVEQLAQI